MASFDPRLMQYSAAQTQQFYKLLAETCTASAPGFRARLSPRTFRSETDDFDGIAFVPEGFQMPRDPRELQLHDGHG